MKTDYNRAYSGIRVYNKYCNMKLFSFIRVARSMTLSSVYQLQLLQQSVVIATLWMMLRLGYSGNLSLEYSNTRLINK